MLILPSLLAGFSIAVLAVPQPPKLVPRRAATCTKYSSANSAISVCATASAFCTSYIGRPASTTSIYSTTQSTTTTLPTVTIKKTVTAATVTSTAYTSTRTITASTSTKTETVTATASVTESDTQTITGTTTVTSTISATETDGTVVTTTTTVGDIPCTTPPSKKKRGILTKPPSSCGLATVASSQVSGACSCFLDRTTTTGTTTTITTRPLTTSTKIVTATATLSAVTTTTTTPVTTVTTTVTPFTVTVATTTVATTTVYPFTTTGVVTTTVATTTTTDTHTATSTTAQPTCTQGDNNSYGPQSFTSKCDTNFVGYTAQITDATDMFDCMSQCSAYNSGNFMFSCVAISFNQGACNSNCYLKQAVDTGTVVQDSDWQSARLQSPVLSTLGSGCLDGTTNFGDLVMSGGSPYMATCGIGWYGGDIYGDTAAPPGQACWSQCSSYTGQNGSLPCTTVSTIGDSSHYCFIKASHYNEQYSETTNDEQDTLILLHGGDADPGRSPICSESVNGFCHTGSYNLYMIRPNKSVSAKVFHTPQASSLADCLSQCETYSHNDCGGAVWQPSTSRCTLYGPNSNEVNDPSSMWIYRYPLEYQNGTLVQGS